MKAVIFGAGSDGKVLKRGLEEHYSVQICAVCDNDRSKWGDWIDGIRIISPQELKQMNYETIFICTSKERWFKEMEAQ